MSNNKKKELVVNTIVVAIGRFSTQLVSFLLLPLYTSILSTEEYGTYDLIITIATFLQPIISLLMEESMFRFLIDCNGDTDKKKVISQSLIYVFCTSLISLIVIFIFNCFIKIPYLFVSILYILSSIILALTNSLIRGIGKIKIYTIFNFITSLITIILNIIFIAIIRIGMNGLLLSTIISNLGTSLVVFLAFKIYKYLSLRSFDKNLMKQMIKYSIPLVPNKLSWNIINLSDRLIVSGVLGTSANGIYSMANKFPSMMNTFYSFFDTAWKESSAKAVRDEEESIFFSDILKRLSKLMFAIALGIIACMPICFNWFINEAYNEAYLYIPILIAAMYYSNISGFYGGIFSAYKDTKIMGSTTFIAALINLIIDIIFIKYLGIYAAAISTLVSCFVVYLYRKYKVKKYVKLINNGLFAYYILTVLTIILYYFNTNIYIKVINLLIVGAYAFYTNKDTLVKIFVPFIKKIVKK